MKHKESIKQFKSNSNNLTLTTKGNLTTSTGLITDSDKEIEKINYTSKIGLKDDKIKNYIKDSLSSGKLKNSINRQKQEIHVKNSPNFIEGRSYFNNDFEELEELLSEVVGTGDVLTDNKGNPINKERIDDIRFKGVYKPKYESIEKDSHKIIICHSKTGYHAYPVRPD